MPSALAAAPDCCALGTHRGQGNSGRGHRPFTKAPAWRVVKKNCANAQSVAFNAWTGVGAQPVYASPLKIAALPGGSFRPRGSSVFVSPVAAACERGDRRYQKAAGWLLSRRRLRETATAAHGRGGIALPLVFGNRERIE